MNNLLISAVQFGIIVGSMFFAGVSAVFAESVVTPASVESVSETSATISAKVIAPQFQTATVWIEWGETSDPINAVGTRSVFESGFFYGYLTNLRPNTTYYVRAVALEGGVTVRSRVSSFSTKGGKSSVANVVVAPVDTQGVNNPPLAGVVEQPKVSLKENTTPVTTKNTNTTTAKPKNTNTALVVGTSDIFPGTLIGWVALLITAFSAILLVLLIVEASENRKKKPTPMHPDDEGDEKDQRQGAKH